jgi:probable selenium-dependent hydroxylase accessory protein YqeC
MSENHDGEGSKEGMESPSPLAECRTASPLSERLHTPSLLECFGITAATRTIALVGAGGKTSLMYALAREIARGGRRVVTTTTTKIFLPTAEESPCLLLLGDDPDLHGLPEKLSRHIHVTVANAVNSSTGKLGGVSDETVRFLSGTADCLLVEADGAAGHPIKAPEQWEPVIPTCADMVIPVVGLDSLGKPAVESWVFRLDRFLAITGLREGAAIDVEALVVAVTHAQGGLKGVGSQTMATPFLNKLDVLDRTETGERIARAIFQKTPTIRRVVAGQLKGRFFATCFVA